MYVTNENVTGEIFLRYHSLHFCSLPIGKPEPIGYEFERQKQTV